MFLDCLQKFWDALVLKNGFHQQQCEWIHNLCSASDFAGVALVALPHSIAKY